MLIINSQFCLLWVNAGHLSWETHKHTQATANTKACSIGCSAAIERKKACVYGLLWKVLKRRICVQVWCVCVCICLCHCCWVLVSGSLWMEDEQYGSQNQIPNQIKSPLRRSLQFRMLISIRYDLQNPSFDSVLVLTRHANKCCL